MGKAAKAKAARRAALAARVTEARGLPAPGDVRETPHRLARPLSAALEEKYALGRFAQSPKGKQMFFEQTEGGDPVDVRYGAHRSPLPETDKVRGDARAMMRMLERVLPRAVITGDLYYSTDATVGAIYLAGHTIPEWQYTPDLMPSNALVWYWARPAPMPEALSAMGYSPLEARDMVPYSGLDLVGLLMIQVAYLGQRLWDEEGWGKDRPIKAPNRPMLFSSLLVRPRGMSHMVPVDIVPTHDGAVTRFPEEGLLPGLEVQDDLALRLTGAFLYFLKQRLIVASTPRLDRRTAKMAVRLSSLGGAPPAIPQEPPVRVVELRHVDYVGAREAGPGREWSCQWVVSGHWRQQPCGPGRSERRPVYIAPYLKGPEDRPLKPPKPTVFAVVR